VGISFRAWARLSRLHACLRLIRQQPAPAWADVAADAGFYDQAHLANEFRALCGLSPTLFLQRGIAQSSKTGD
jgi:transcriptional regulator GlxA family with amidase domain